MKAVIISQARMASTRLPGKVLKKVMGKPLLQYHIERLRRVPSASEVMVATTTHEVDDAVAHLCREIDCPVYRGEEHDVLHRYFGAALACHAEVVVRVTSDCPLIDPFVTNQVIQFYLRHHPEYDYVSNTVHRTYPRGLDSEVFPFRILEEACRDAEQGQDREHVTTFLRSHPERFRIGSVTRDGDVSHHRWTVDTSEDFELIQRILEAFGGSTSFTLEDILRVMEEHPDWATINRHVQQKDAGSTEVTL